MPTPPGNPANTRSNRGIDLLMFFVVVVITAVAYAPMLSSVFRLSLRTTQALNAFVLIVFAFLEAFRIAWRESGFVPRVNGSGFLLFCLACLLLTASSLLALWPLAVLALCFNLAALCAFAFGRSGVAAFTPALAALGAAVALLIMIPGADVWLRMLAAKCAAPVLDLLDIKTQILVADSPFRVGLWVEKGHVLFDVATECNGFGIILSSVVMAIIVSWRHAYSWPLRAGVTAGAAVLGLGFNVVRIVAIGWTSLNTTMDYKLIHEGLGSVLYFVALGVVYAVASVPRFSTRLTKSGAIEGAGTAASNHSRTSADSPTPCM